MIDKLKAEIAEKTKKIEVLTIQFDVRYKNYQI